MKEVNFRTTSGILDELQNAVSQVSEDRASIDLANSRITGCKHAIQIYALSITHARMQNIVPTKLKQIEME